MSDHFSGPRALAGPAGDITDMWAFPSPERPGHLVLVAGLMPAARPGAAFSEAIVCRFRLRPLTVAGTGPQTSFRFGPEAEELVVECGFSAPHPWGSNGGRAQTGWCTTPSGETVRFTVGDEQGASGDGVRVYAGYRADPFFFDLPAWLESVQSGRLAFKERGSNALEGLNLLGVVVEIDLRMLVADGRGPLFGVVTETIAAGPLPIRLERFGRPEIKNVILAQKGYDKLNPQIELRDLYNLEDAFHMSGDYSPAYAARISANLAAFDKLDSRIGWPLGADGEHPLTNLLLDDYMVIDVSKPFATDTYFEIETAMLEGRPHETCGGRWLDDDIMDVMFRFMISGVPGAPVSDGVDAPWKPASMEFPYLASPNPNPPASVAVPAPPEHAAR
jgi:hypothetical protein